jgi:hypothetical protein
VSACEGGERHEGRAQNDATNLAANRDRRRGRCRRGGISRRVKNRTLEPDYVFDVVLDLRHVAVMDVDRVRCEVAVGDSVAVIVTMASGTHLVNVCRRQRCRERQKRCDEEQGQSASGRTTHGGIIQVKGSQVNWRRVRAKSPGTMIIARVPRFRYTSSTNGKDEQMFCNAVMLIATLYVHSTIGPPVEQAAKPVPSIEVTAPKDVTNVEALNDTLSALSQKVTACVQAGGKPETCQCSDPKDLIRLRKGYESLVKQHPDWKDQLLSYRYVNREGRNINGTIVLQNLRRQLEQLKCE